MQRASALRLRVGDYRVVFSEADDEILVTGLGRAAELTTDGGV